MIQLLDRGIISVETIYKVFGHDFAIELENLRLEQQIRDKEPPILERADPYHRPVSVMQFQEDAQVKLEKLKQGAISPGGDNLGGDQPKREGIAPTGRPPGQKDIKIRDIRTPKTLSILKAKAEEFIEEIDNLIDPIFLSKNKIKNVRSLTKKQKSELQDIKVLILSNLRLDDFVTIVRIEEIINKPLLDMANNFHKMLKELCLEYKSQNNKELSMGVLKSLEASCWAMLA